MAENLNYKAEGSKCYCDYEGNGDKYGRLYELETAKAVCPEGWRLPDGANDLELFGNFIVAILAKAHNGNWYTGRKMKASDGWFQNGGTDEFGFGALPGGYCGSDGKFSVNLCGLWWLGCTMSSSYNVEFNSMAITRGAEAVVRFMNKGCFLSVRYVKDL